MKPPLSRLLKYGHLPQPGGKLRRFYIVRMRKTARFFIIAHWTPLRTAAPFHDVGGDQNWQTPEDWLEEDSEDPGIS